MGIRKATLDDSKAIRGLLEELGYPQEETVVAQKMAVLINTTGSGVYVYEDAGDIIAFIAMNFIPQLALTGDFMRISYFAVHHQWQGKGIGKELEAFCVEVAKRKQCDRMEVHCHERRKEAHQFYYRQGYEESPKYLIKLL